MNARIRQKLARRKRRIQKGLDKSDLRGCSQPMFTARNIQYQLSERSRGIAYGGGSARGWAERTVGARVAFNAEKQRFIYRMIELTRG